MSPYSDPVSKDSPVLSIGMFDGVHRGHQSLLLRGREIANQRGTELVVLSFDPHPLYVLNPEFAPPMITSVDQRKSLLKDFGADRVVIKKFTEEFSQYSSQRFVEEVVVGELRARSVIIGENFTFGHKASGSVATLRQLGEGQGFEVISVSLAKDQEVISSSRIRKLITEREIKLALDLLGHDFALAGTVIKGDRRGRELGYPTANLEWNANLLVPGDGIYAGYVRLGTQRHPAAISVGTNPQFNGQTQRVEAFILDGTDWNLYGQQVEFEFDSFLRPQQVFDDLAGYLNQMQVDVASARTALR